MYLMCSYVPHLPITLNDLEICNSGLRIVLKHVRFVETREESSIEPYEAHLLENLGELILGLLRVDSHSWSTQAKIKKIQNKNVLSCLLNARQGHRNYE